jgi:hypothetical protein
MTRSSKILAAAVACAALSVLVAAGPAAAASPWWQLTSSAQPTNLPPGGSGTITLVANDLGDANVEAGGDPVTISDTLPAGLEATAIEGRTGPLGSGEVTCTRVPLRCSFEGTLPAYEALQVEISVNVTAQAVSGLENEASISGGGAPAASVRQPVTVSNEPVRFGVEQFQIQPEGPEGKPVTQAGSHPFQLTTTALLDRTGQAPFQPAQPKDLHFELPPGLIGNPTPFPQCSEAKFSARIVGDSNECPPDTAVGVAMITIDERELFGEFTFPVPLFNLVPAPGEPARFGFEVLSNPVVLDTSVRTGGDYGVTVSTSNITELTAFLDARVTFWGVPGDPRHDPYRGWGCLYGESCTAPAEGATPPLLTLPTSCGAAPQTTLLADSWADPGEQLARTWVFQNALGEPFGLDGCNRLSFAPQIGVTPDGQAGSSPTGLTVGIHVGQETILEPEGLAQADVKDTTVTLPEGVALNPAAADGLEACPLLYGKEAAQEARESAGTLSGIDLETPQPANCPEASKVGLVRIKSPLLPNELTGAAYLAAQNENPFKSLVALYVVVRDPVSGTLIKLAGEVRLDPTTGQLVTTFENTPQLPFEDFKLEFFGGDRAPLGTPAQCGTYTTSASIAPWSANVPAQPSSTFTIASGPGGAPCQNPLPFSPSLTAGTTSVQAGGFSPFTMTVSREDGQQNIQQLQLRMPPGLSGLVTGVELCGEAQADAGTCGPGSLIGETTVSVGLGGDPYSVSGGKVYITGPYEGAPFGLSVVVPADAGPYKLGQVVVRGTIQVDPVTSALTVTTNTPAQGYAIPRILDGIPLQIRHVNFVTARPGFTFNPTDCNPLGVSGSISSVEGATSPVSVPFQVTNCAALGFKPQFSVSTSGKTSRARGASLHVKLAYPKAPFGSQANIASVKVDLPRQLPSRLSTLQKACPEGVFAANPAACPAGSRIGTAKAITPLVPVALTGPVYFVSHGGAKFPELIVVLTGYGVTVDLHSETFISKAGITSSTFRTIPDVPVGTFELTLPEGGDSALAANANLCTVKGGLKMPTAFTAQSGAVIHQSTKIGVTGCPKAHRAKRGKVRHRARKR